MSHCLRKRKYVLATCASPPRIECFSRKYWWYGISSASKGGGSAKRRGEFPRAPDDRRASFTADTLAYRRRRRTVVCSRVFVVSSGHAIRWMVVQQLSRLDTSSRFRFAFPFEHVLVATNCDFRAKLSPSKGNTNKKLNSRSSNLTCV